jgi:hypothetical protein
VTKEQKRALSERLEASSSEAGIHAHHVREARKAIAVLAVLFVIGGALLFVMGLTDANKALHELAALDADLLLPEPIGGVTYTVGELRDLVEREPYQVLGLNALLAGIMLGLFFWAKRAALPAILTALAVFVTVHVGNMIIDPKTIFQGIVVKIVAIIVLVRGTRAALAARAFEQRMRQGAA